MAIPADAVWNVIHNNVDPNGVHDGQGGFFSAGTPGAGTDYSLVAAVVLSRIDGVSVGTAVLTSGTGGFTAAMVGNGICLSAFGSGGVIFGDYCIVGFTNVNTITLDRNVTAGTYDFAVGGSKSSPGQAAKSAVDGNKIYVKNSVTCTITTSTPGSEGPVVLPASAQILLEGYTTTHGDLGSQAVISAGSIGGIAIVTLNGTFNDTQFCVNIKADGNSQTSTVGFLGSNPYVDSVILCQAVNCTTAGFSATLKAEQCFASACATGFSALSSCHACSAKSCTTAGFVSKISAPAPCPITFCIATLCQIGFVTGYGAICENCDAYGSTGDGFATDGTYDLVKLENCISVSSGGYGYDYSINGGKDLLMINCAGYNNTSGNINASSVLRSFGFVTLTANPFTNAAGNDFSLNTTAGGGAACRASGVPGVFNGLSTTGYLDIGSVQHQDTGGAGLALPVARII